MLNIRSAFTASRWPDRVLLAFDYSQIEVRVIAHMSGDPALLAALDSGRPTLVVGAERRRTRAGSAEELAYSSEQAGVQR